ncbi:hypothetical protein [Hymenobacter terricola]|uniref:hypothetical protein n=1 Tax=Hymenobacter terricola TaxID=2819236 RepID=UPI001B310567|nr:hypothetical protein [Hymenobacter terricola]
MKQLCYSLFTAGSLALLMPSVQAAVIRHVPIDSPADAQRKAARARKAMAREKVATANKAALLTRHSSGTQTAKFHSSLRELLGFEDSKAANLHAKLDRQLHQHQKHLKVKAKIAAKARRAHAHA